MLHALGVLVPLHGELDPAAVAAGDTGSGWLIGFVASAIIAVTFLAVAVALGTSLTRTKQWHANPLGVATFLLYVTCGGGHFFQTLQMMYPWLGIDAVYGSAARVHYGEWHLWLADGVTAAMGVWYWTMRKYFPDLVRGTAVYEDLRTKQHEALEIHDNVVQGLARAKLSLDLAQDAEGRQALEETIVSSRRIVEAMMGKPIQKEVAPDGV
jgi:hypothetical protein